MSDNIDAGNVVRLWVDFTPFIPTPPGTAIVIVLGDVTATIETPDGVITVAGIAAGQVDPYSLQVVSVANCFYADVTVPETATSGEWQPIWRCATPTIVRADPDARFAVTAILPFE